MNDICGVIMNKEHLMANGKLFAYETSKYFASPERLIKQYTCKDEIVVLSSVRIYIYFFEGFIDMKDELLANVDLIEIEKGYSLSIRGKELSLVFDTLDEKRSFYDYVIKFSTEDVNKEN